MLFLDHVGVLGGGELSLLDIATDWRETGRVVLLADGPFRERLEAAGVPVRVLDSTHSLGGLHREGGGAADLLAAPAVLALARRVAGAARRADLIYCNSQKAAVVGGLAGTLARRPVIWHLRDMLTAEHFSATRRRLAVAAGNLLATRVIANSEATARAFVESGGRPARVRVVYNGINPAPFLAVTAAEARAVHAELGLGDAPLVGAFSRLTPWKGQHILLDALAALPGVHALLVGEALFGEEDYTAALRERAARLGIAARVHFLGFRADIPRLMAAVDVVAHSAIAPEPFGRMIVEGMLAGRPVVATRAGGAEEIITDGEDGLLVPPGDAGSLAAALGALLDDRARAVTLAQRGRETALRRFSVEAMLAGVEREIRALT